MLAGHATATATASAFGRALIVEDDRVLRRALARALRAWGMETLEAGDVRSARRLLQCEPDLVVTDVRLPDGTGHEVAQRAARLHTPPFVVAMSGEATPEEAFALARASVQVYLEKPFTLDQLQARISEVRTRGVRDEAPLAWDDSVPESVRGPLLSALSMLAEERRLTPRETEILRLAVAGTPRSALPAALGVSENTCKTLVRGTLRKCGLRRVAQVATWVLARVQWQQVQSG